MKRTLKFLARLYPSSWRNRYSDEFEALLDDISPTFGDVCDVLGGVLQARMTTSMDAYLVTAPASPMTSRLPVIASVGVHGLTVTLVLLAIWGQVTTMPLHVVAPLPPPVPEPPPQVTDARVFPNALSLYSSLPLKMPAQGGTLHLYVADGVGINFLPLPDIGARYRQGNEELASLARPGAGRLCYATRAAGVSPRNKYARRGVCIRGISDSAGRIGEGSASLWTGALPGCSSVGGRTLGLSAAGLREASDGNS